MIPNPIRWTQGRILAAMASRTVRNYFDLPRTPYTFRYEQNVKREQIDLITPSGESQIIKTDTFGSATATGVVFYGPQTVFTAEHEFAHLYHLNHNESAVDLQTRLKKLNDEIRAGKSVMTDEWLNVTGSCNIALETLAYSFNTRFRTNYHSGMVKSFDLAECTPTFVKELIERLERNAQVPEMSVAAMVDIEPYKACNNDKELTRSYFRNLSDLQYEIGKVSAGIFFIAPNSKPQIKVRNVIDPASKKFKFGIGIEYELRPVNERQRILQTMFTENVDELRDLCVSCYAQVVDPQMKEGFGQLALAVRKMKF